MGIQDNGFSMILKLGSHLIPCYADTVIVAMAELPSSVKSAAMCFTARNNSEIINHRILGL